MSGESPSTGARLLAVGRLVRVSLLPSALADAAAGVVLGAGAWPAGAAPLRSVLAGGCVFLGGMALNDWADRRQDALVRPDRPIPSGRVPAGFALALGLGLLVAGPLLAASVDARAGLLLAGVALAAFGYDVAGRGPLRGPLLLALCRAGNLGAGLLAGLALGVGSGPPPALALLLPLSYGAYVFLVSRLGRLEDGEDQELGRRPRGLLRGAASLLLVLGLAAPLAGRAGDPGALPRWLPHGAALALALAAAWPLVRASARVDWTRGDVLAAMGMCLRRLLVIGMLVAIGAGTRDGLAVAAVLALGVPLGFWLRRVFPPS